VSSGVTLSADEVDTYAAGNRGGRQGPKAEMEALIKDRLPVPRVVECDQNGSQARFLLAKLNPSATHNNNNNSQVSFCLHSLTDRASGSQLTQAHSSRFSPESGRASVRET